MILNGVWLLLAVGAWAAYRLACWIGEPERTTDRPNGSIQAEPVGGDPSFGQKVTIRPICPQPCEHLSQEDAREGRTCPEHPCTCADRLDGSAS